MVPKSSGGIQYVAAAFLRWIRFPVVSVEFKLAGRISDSCWQLSMEFHWITTDTCAITWRDLSRSRMPHSDNNRKKLYESLIPVNPDAPSQEYLDKQETYWSRSQEYSETVSIN
jgi:hypothetical protein